MYVSSDGSYHSLKTSIEVVGIGNLVEIPSETQVRPAISKLYKIQKEFPDKFSYINFSFGTIDYGGLDIT